MGKGMKFQTNETNYCAQIQVPLFFRKIKKKYCFPFILLYSVFDFDFLSEIKLWKP